MTISLSQLVVSLSVLWLIPQSAQAFSASPSTPAQAVHDSLSYPDYISAEVVGAAGRIGSLFLSTTARAVPKGVAPGSLSRPNTPIYVCTASNVWPSILACTPQERRDDLVWMGNGFPPTSQGTTVVPHFGILEYNADPMTSPESPPTYLYGKHAALVQTYLEEKGIQTKCLDSFVEIEQKAAQKLLWASSFWLLCHVSTDSPRTVVEVPDEELDSLVAKELFPALCARLPDCQFDLEECLIYLNQYSRSMPQAIPKKELCRKEWNERNAFFLAVRDRVPQPHHEDLLRTVGGISQEEMDRVVQEESSENTPKAAQQPTPQKHVDIPSLGLSFMGKKETVEEPSNPKTAIVVGSGILGSSLALHLARQGLQVQVVDIQSTEDLGVTTPASWAWLNANGKAPPEYAWLNQLGMDGWRRDPLLVNLPNWSGAIVRFAQPQSPLLLKGYRAEGPLSETRLKELEPSVDLYGDDGYAYFFPDEGFVDPSIAVQTLRKEAIKLGVSFQGHVNVTGFLRSEDNRISGITAETKGDAENKEEDDILTMEADIVILAAGIGVKQLGNIPLLHRPGQIAFAKPLEESQRQQSLQRILVDTVRESHVLQRQDGTFVTGGGALEVGGKGTAALQTAGNSKDWPLSADEILLRRARQVVPGMIGELLRSEQAVRPVPQDGLPAVGYINNGLYALVSHSGVTLAPILGALAATEIANRVSIEALQPFRPTRFSSGTSPNC